MCGGSGLVFYLKTLQQEKCLCKPLGGERGARLRLEGLAFPLRSSQANSPACWPRQWLLYRQFLAEKR